MDSSHNGQVEFHRRGYLGRFAQDSPRNGVLPLNLVCKEIRQVGNQVASVSDTTTTGQQGSLRQGTTLLIFLETLQLNSIGSWYIARPARLLAHGLWDYFTPMGCRLYQLLSLEEAFDCVLCASRARTARNYWLQGFINGKLEK